MLSLSKKLIHLIKKSSKMSDFIKFELNNWNQVHYTNGKLRALLGMGATPSVNGADIHYSLVVLDEHNNEIHQEDIPTLEQACSEINRRYLGQWELKNSEEKKSGSGCGSCVAH